MKQSTINGNRARLSKAIRAGLKSKNMTQYELAKRLDISQVTVMRWVKKRNLATGDKLLKLAEILDINLTEIFK